MTRWGWGLIAVILSTSASAHQAPTGWSYPLNCCSNNDCREVPTKAVHEGRNGYAVPSKELIPYGDKRLRDSPDGEFHWCTIGGTDRGATICLFVPPRTN